MRDKARLRTVSVNVWKVQLRNYNRACIYVDVRIICFWFQCNRPTKTCQIWSPQGEWTLSRVHKNFYYFFRSLFSNSNSLNLLLFFLNFWNWESLRKILNLNVFFLEIKKKFAKFAKLSVQFIRILIKMLQLWKKKLDSKNDELIWFVKNKRKKILNKKHFENGTKNWKMIILTYQQILWRKTELWQH